MAKIDNPFEKIRSKMVSARIEFMSQLAKFSNDELTKQLTVDEWSPLQLAHHLYIADGLALEQSRFHRFSQLAFSDSRDFAIHKGVLESS